MGATDINKVPVTLVDLDLDTCALTYGTAPCTAAVGTSGTDRCYNTFRTCQDAANYDRTSKTYRFTMADGPNLPGLAAYPCIRSIQTTPTVIDQRRGLGVREDVRLELDDFLDEDVGVDPYYKRRTVRTARRFFVRLKKRNRAIQGRSMTVRHGYLEADGTLLVDDMTTRTYILESIELGSRGKVTIVAKDLLKLLDGVKIPTPTSAKLAAAINSAVTTLAVGTGEGSQFGAATFYFRIDDEIMACTAISGDTFTTITRAQFGTTAASHSADAKVQLARAWTGADAVDDIWEDLLLESGITAGQMDKASFTTDVDKYVASVLPNVCFTEPTNATTLLADLMVQTNCFTWWDAEDQKVMAAHIKPRQPGETLAEINDDYNIVGDSAHVVPQEELRITRAWVAHGIKDWSQGLEEISNYSQHVRYIDSDAESANDAGDEKGRTIYCYWLAASISTVAASLCYRIVSRYVYPPVRIPLDIEAKDEDSLHVGDLVELTTHLLVDDTGAPEATECFIVAKRRKAGRLGEWSLILETAGTAGRWWFWAGPGAGTYPTDSDYAHWAGADEKMPNGDPPYILG